jgi:hypothetical protein
MSICRSITLRRTSRFSLLTLAVIALSSLFNALPARAQSGIELENVGATVTFGEQILFVATIKPSIPIQNVEISIFDESQGIRRTVLVSVQPDGHTEYRLDTNDMVLRPFSLIKWNYQFTFTDGSTTNSEVFSVRYADDRFDWQTLESGTLRVSWYEGDEAFGQAAMDTMQAGLASVSKLVAVDLAQPVEFYIYANADDLRATLGDNASQWIAGHADPTLGVVMVIIEPGAEQNIDMEQRIPHELMHVMLYRAVGPGYRNIPAWLSEGTATLVEIYPNADFDRVLMDAAENNRLLPLSSLCGAFPADTGQAFLAYAESRSFTDYLHQTYGSSGLLKLASSYADGVDCERGTELAFDVPLASLETRWRAARLGQTPILPALQNLTPYLVLLCIVLGIPMISIMITMRGKGNRNGPDASKQ